MAKLDIPLIDLLHFRPAAQIQKCLLDLFVGVHYEWTVVLLRVQK